MARDPPQASALGLELLEEVVEELVARDDIDLAALDRVYRAVLVEIVTLSHSIAGPDGTVGPGREALA